MKIFNFSVRHIYVNRLKNGQIPSTGDCKKE